MGQVRMEWHGDEIEKRLIDAQNRGLFISAEHLLGATIPLTPIRDNPLRNSGTASVDNAKSTAAVSFDTPYAVVQHERLDFVHKEGQAKFLETAMHTEGPTIQAIIAATIRRSMR